MKTYGPTTQCNSKTMDYVKCSKCPRLAITDALNLNHHRSIAWSMTVCLSIRRCLSLSTQYVDRPTPVALPRFCNQETTGWVLWWSTAWRDKAAWWLCAHSPDAVPPIHAVSSYVATDKDPSK